MARYGFPVQNKPDGKRAEDSRLVPADQCQSALEKDFPRLVETIQTMWGYPELNAYFAKLQGVKFVINTDAHHRDQMDYMRYGIKIARRAWLTKEDVLNTKTAEQLLNALKK